MQDGIGKDTEAILTDKGFTPEEIAALKSKNVIR
jgi:predicted flap endonuclease-1-like 5' DNA nuclease